MGVLLKIVNCVVECSPSLDGRYVVEYDPKRGGTGPDGVGWCHLETTADRRKAKVFPSIKEALEYWRQSSGLREDGEPNRPLTAFTVTFEQAPEKEK